MRIQSINQNNYQNKNHSKGDIVFKMNTCFRIEGLKCPMDRLGKETLANLTNVVIKNLMYLKRAERYERIRLFQDKNCTSVIFAIDQDTFNKMAKVNGSAEAQQVMTKICDGIETYTLDWNKIRPGYKGS